jgi:hypothetical protein
MKAQGFIISSMIILLALTILQFSFFNFRQKNLQLTYDYRIEQDYFDALRNEMLLSASLTDENSLENFMMFLNFSKTEAISKNYDVKIFAVHVSNNDNNPNAINVTLINFLDKNISVFLALNSTPEQTDSAFIQKDKYYSKIFSVDRQKDYSLLISYTDSFNMTLDLRNTDSIFVFLDLNATSEKFKYIDKSQKSYYFT